MFHPGLIARIQFCQAAAEFRSVVVFWLCSECCTLLRCRFFLVFRAPSIIRHSVDGFARRVFCHGLTVRGGRFLHPIAQAVATKACEVHEIDVLDVRTFTQVRHQAAVHCCFQLGLRLWIGGCHGRLRCCLRGHWGYPYESSLLEFAQV